jgi:hypothetical protein
MSKARARSRLAPLVALFTVVAATMSLTSPPATASGGALSDLELTGPSISLTAQPTPFLFHGTASAKDDSTNVVATFSSGTATYAVNGVSQGTLTSGVGSPATLNTGVTEITVTHTSTGSIVTVYTIKVARSFPITGFSVIDADDSTVLYNYPAPFDDDTVIPPITVGHNVDRIRYLMTYANPTGSPGMTGYQTWIHNGGYCPSSCASGEWSPPFTLSVGSNSWGPLTQVSTTIGTANTIWFTNITRATAFTAIGSLSVPPPATPIPAGTPITVSPGGVTGNPPPVITYTWEAAPTASDPFQPVATTVTPVWTPDNTVADHVLRVVATADNGYSTPTSITSTIFGPIAGVPEGPRVATVTISGTADEGQTLTATSRVLGYPRPAVSYRWLRATDDTAGFSAISGATGSTYALTAADVNHVLRVEVTASANAHGPADQAQSISTARVTGGSNSSPGPNPPGPGGGDNGVTGPGAPESVAVNVDGRKLLVSWRPPSYLGNSTVSHYDVLLQPTMARCLTTSLTCVMDVRPGRTYQVSVRALSGGGWGLWADVTVAVPRLAFAATMSKGRLWVMGTSVNIPEGVRLNVRITRHPAGNPRVVSGPLITTGGNFQWSRKLRGTGLVSITLGYDSTWSRTRPIRPI